MGLERIEKIFYLEGAKYSLKEIKTKALFFTSFYLRFDEIEEDYWFGIADNWDLNIWEDHDHAMFQATLYPVVNGKTDYSISYPLFPELPILEKD